MGTEVIGGIAFGESQVHAMFDSPFDTRALAQGNDLLPYAYRVTRKNGKTLGWEAKIQSLATCESITCTIDEGVTVATDTGERARMGILWQSDENLLWRGETSVQNGVWGSFNLIRYSLFNEKYKTAIQLRKFCTDFDTLH